MEQLSTPVRRNVRLDDKLVSGVPPLAITIRLLTLCVGDESAFARRLAD